MDRVAPAIALFATVAMAAGSACSVAVESTEPEAESQPACGVEEDVLVQERFARPADQWPAAWTAFGVGASWVEPGSGFLLAGPGARHGRKLTAPLAPTDTLIQFSFSPTEPQSFVVSLYGDQPRGRSAEVSVTRRFDAFGRASVEGLVESGPAHIPMTDEQPEDGATPRDRSAGRWWLRIRVRRESGGDYIGARLWRDGTAEPERFDEVRADGLASLGTFGLEAREHRDSWSDDAVELHSVTLCKSR
ncbi:MAG: hypothetical protein HOW73_09630 [Polyangiaceae bacterium]|nr:hypothetical protein [Polyangiaceae bacterium]